MLEMFVELLYDGKPRIERVMYCYIDGTLYNDMLESRCHVPGSKPVTKRDHEACKWAWDALIAVEEAHYRDPKIAKEPVRWFCVDPKVG